MGTLLLIRHGQASYGEADYDRLSTRGQDQARALGTLSRAAARSISSTSARCGASKADRGARRRERAGNLPAPTTLPELAEYPAFELLQHFMPKLVAEDPKFAALDANADARARERGVSHDARRWARDEWDVEGVERVTAFAARVRARPRSRRARRASSGARIAVVTSAGPIGVAVGLTFGATRAPHGSHEHRDPQRVDHRAAVSLARLRLASRARVAHRVQLDPPPAARAAHGVLTMDFDPPESVRPLLEQDRALHRRRRDARRSRGARAAASSRRRRCSPSCARRCKARRHVGPAAAEGARRARASSSSSTASSPSGSAARRSATTCSARRRPTPATWRSSTSTARRAEGDAGSSRSRAARSARASR